MHCIKYLPSPSLYQLYLRILIFLDLSWLRLLNLPTFNLFESLGSDIVSIVDLLKVMKDMILHSLRLYLLCSFVFNSATQLHTTFVISPGTAPIRFNVRMNLTSQNVSSTIYHLSIFNGGIFDILIHF